MAAVATVVDKALRSDGKYDITGTIAFDASYPTGGETISITGIERWSDLRGGGSGYSVVGSASTQKALVYYSDNNNASDGPDIQVPDTTDLSSLTAVPFRAVGR